MVEGELDRGGVRGIKLYLLAPEERRAKFEQEIVRPTFALREKPLREVCGFVSFSVLTEKMQGIRQLGIGASLKPDLLTQIAEYFKDDRVG